MKAKLIKESLNETEWFPGVGAYLSKIRRKLWFKGFKWKDTEDIVIEYTDRVVEFLRTHDKGDKIALNNIVEIIAKKYIKNHEKNS